MATQEGILKIKGTIGGMTFYKSKDGHLVREKGGVDGSRIASDPAFARTRENGQEFGNGGTSGKYLRDAVRNMMLNASDNRVVSRLVQVLMSIQKLDTVSERGLRTVEQGLSTAEGKAMLNGFDFNINAVFGSIFFKSFGLDPLTGTVNIDNLIPLADILAPSGATHFSLKSGFAVIDFNSGVSALNVSDEIIAALDNTTQNVSLAPIGGAPAGSGIKVHLLLISFYQQVNGFNYSLKSGAYNALTIIGVA